MSVAYLEKLNDQQRLAVEHGVALPEGKLAGPRLIIAGAGSGKTNTLAHRVAHLIVNGADPRRILLMTFSRRAASEMARRVERICKQVLGPNSGILTDALTWSGTFHGIGARPLRIYATRSLICRSIASRAWPPSPRSVVSSFIPGIASRNSLKFRVAWSSISIRVWTSPSPPSSKPPARCVTGWRNSASSVFARPPAARAFTS